MSEEIFINRSWFLNLEFRDFKDSSKDLLLLGLPITGSYLVSYSSAITTALSVAYLNDSDMLAALGIGNLLANVAGFSIGFGLLTVLDTVVSQAAGSKNFRQGEIHMIRARIIALLATALCIPLMIYSDVFLLGQSTVVVKHAHRFVLGSIIGLLPAYLFAADSSYLRSYHFPRPSLVFNLIGTIFQGIFCVMFVNFFKFGLVGAALSQGMTNWLKLILLQFWMFRFANTDFKEDSDQSVLYKIGGSLVCKELSVNLKDVCKALFIGNFFRDLKTLFGEFFGSAGNSGIQLNHSKAFILGATSSTDIQSDRESPAISHTPKPLREELSEGLRSYMSVAWSSAILVWCEWWAYELQALIAGWRGVEVLAAHVVCCNVEVLLFMIPLGLQLSASVLVGNNLGSNSPMKSSVYAVSSIGLALLITGIAGTIVVLLRKPISTLYTLDESILHVLNKAFIIVGLYHVFNGTNCVVEGVLRGMKIQQSAVYFKLAVMVVFQLPLAYVLSRSFNLIGIWIAAISSNAVLLLLFFRLIARSDFKLLALTAEPKDLENQPLPPGSTAKEHALVELS